jgi:site-specific recombinase XerD
MSGITIRQRVEDYLAMRRALGFALVQDGRLLLDFADRLDQDGQDTVTVPAALAWAATSQASANQQARRLGSVRVFARHLHALDPACQIPAPGLLPARAHRPTPFIYSEADIAALVHAAGTITAPLPSATVKALISLIASTGLRIGEALGLNRTDVDTAMLTVTGKGGKTRLVPIHPTTAAMLAEYARHRDRLCALVRADSFFLTTGGRRPLQRGVQDTFARLLTQAEIDTPPGRRRPRIHDLRHSFAVNTLTDWQREGIDIAAQLPVLSTYLGHSGPEATYWYLQATGELLGLAAARLEPIEQERP